MDRMTVAIDATPLAGERTGVGVAVAGLVGALAGRTEVDLVGYAFTATGGRLVVAALPPGVRAATRPMPAGALLRTWGRLDWPPGEWWTGPVDILHGTNFVVPPSRRAARLVYVHDLTPVRYPQLCPPPARRYPGLVARAVARGAWVQTGSQAMADEIVEHFGVERARVKVIPPGVHQSPVEPRPRGGRPYLLGLGTTEPRKDFPLLVRAFDLLGGGHPDLDLRIVGPAGWAEKAVQDAIAASPYRHRIHRLGWVPDPSALMAGAEVFVYPSIYEGFGFPPLEAMVEGVPVVATAAGAVPEVAGPAALLVDPGDAPGLAGAIERVLDDGSLRSELVRAGRDRAREFSWGRTAEALLAVYRELLERSPGRRGR